MDFVPFARLSAIDFGRLLDELQTQTDDVERRGAIDPYGRRGGRWYRGRGPAGLDPGLCRLQSLCGGQSLQPVQPLCGGQPLQSL